MVACVYTYAIINHIKYISYTCIYHIYIHIYNVYMYIYISHIYICYIYINIHILYIYNHIYVIYNITVYNYIYMYDIHQWTSGSPRNCSACALEAANWPRGDARSGSGSVGHKQVGSGPEMLVFVDSYG